MVVFPFDTRGASKVLSLQSAESKPTIIYGHPSTGDQTPTCLQRQQATASWIFKSKNKVLCSSFPLFIPAIMDATLCKKKSRKGKGDEEDFSKARSASVAPSSDHKMDSKKDQQNEDDDDDVQLQYNSTQDTTNQKRPDYPKKPPTSYNFFVKAKHDKIVRNNPGMNSMEISSLTGKMFKALSEKKKQKYVELAKVAREKYEKEVRDFKEANPITKPVETSEKMEAPLAPTPFLIFCSKKKKQSISWCRNKFPSLSDREKLKWIDLALAEEANYLHQFEKFKAENPHLKPKIMPILNEEEKLLVYMRDAKPVKPPRTGLFLFASEFPQIPSKKDGNQNRMEQWSASWNALSKEEKKVYQERVIAMKNDYNNKLSAYLAKLPDDKRRQEIVNCLPDARGIKRKKGVEMDKLSGASFNKKSKPAFNAESDSYSSDEEQSPTPVNVGRKKKAPQVKGSGINKSSSIAVVSRADSDNNNDAIVPKKKLIAPPNLAEESSEESYEESDDEPKESNLPKKPASILASNSLVKNDSSSSVRPLWASQQNKLYKNEPPKPPKTAAEWHAIETCKVLNIPDAKKKAMWKELPKKKRRMLKIEHTKMLEEYEEKLQAFKKGLSQSERQAFEHIKRLQCVSDDDSE